MADESSSAGVRSHRRAPRPPDPTTRRRRRGRAVVGGTVALGVAVIGAWAFGAVGAESDASTPCADGYSVLTVTAAPEIAQALEEATRDGARGLLSGDASCLRVEVTAGAAADVAAALGGASAAEGIDVPALPDVWVPDSSLWLEGVAPQRVAGAGGSSIATSPVVLAVSRAAAEGLGWPAAPLDLVSGLGTGASSGRLGLPDPRRSVPTRAALLAVDQGLSAQPDGALRLSTALRAADTSLDDDSGTLLQALEDAVGLAVPVPEQAVFAHNRSGEAPMVVASYPATAGVLDYPFVVLAESAAKRADAEVVRAALAGPAWTELAQAAGFRGTGGAPGAALREQEGLDVTTTVGAAADPAALQEALRTFRVITMGTRMLAVIDVSGSMAAPVPGLPGQTRMDLAGGAAANGLGLYPDDAEIGLWVFSTALTPTADHQELVPLGPVGVQADGVQGREKLARALAAVEVVPHGDTGLYDTALEAVRTVRSSWDPDRVNSVVLMTDGRNDDATSISLEQLLAQLQAEAGDRPVPVIGIAFGPDSDVDALRLISQATGGATYEVDDVRRIHEVLADALAQRPCRPSC